MIAAQRYPEAFDGIVAGAPELDWTNLMTGFVWRGKALHGSPEGDSKRGWLRSMRSQPLT